MGVVVPLLGFCVVALLVYVGRYSARISVTQTRYIRAAPAQVRALVVDLKRWPQWNPWLEDDAASVTACSAVADARGSACTWSRPGVSVATFTHVLVGADRVVQRARFREPFPFRGRATWTIAAAPGGALLTWSVRGHVGFALRAFASTVQGAVALDLRYGLDRLAALVEPAGEAGYALAYDGPRHMPAVRYAYRAMRVGIAEIAGAVDAAAVEVGAALEKAGIRATDGHLAIYLNTDVRRRVTECRVGVPLDVDAPAEPHGVATAGMPAHRAFVAQLRGSRTPLELAWYLTMRRMRAAGLEPDLAMPPFERRSSAGGAHGDAPIELCIPVRAPV